MKNLHVLQRDRKSEQKRNKSETQKKKNWKQSRNLQKLDHRKYHNSETISKTQTKIYTMIIKKTKKTQKECTL